MRVTQRAGQWLITDRQQRLSQPPENVDLGATPKPNRGDLRPQKGLGWERGECRGCPLQSWDVTGFQQPETVAQSCSGCAVCVNGPCMEAPARGPGGARCGEPARTGGPAASGRFFRLLQKGTHSRREVAGGRWTPDSESRLAHRPVQPSVGRRDRLWHRGGKEVPGRGHEGAGGEGSAVQDKTGRKRGLLGAPPPGGEATRRGVPVEEHTEASCLGIQPRPRLPRERPGTAKSKPEDSKCH